MKKKLIKKSILLFVIVITSFFLLYRFMTYDRTYTWAKEFPYDIEKIATSQNLKIEKSEPINIEKIKLPIERKVKIKIQKFLNKFDLMPYGKEFGEKIILKSADSNIEVTCKSWCLGDHLIGLEIEYNNIEKTKLDELKKQFENKFPNYKLVWTKIE